MWIACGAVEAVGEVAQAARGPARGCCPGAPSTSTQAMPRPGNSAAMCGATQPCSGAGSQPRSEPAASAPPSQPASARRGRAAAAARPGRSSCARGELADAGALQGAAGVDVGEGRAAADPVEAGDGAVAVVADRHLPAALADQFANGVAVVADVEREEAHPPTVAPVDRARPRPAGRRSRRPCVNQNEITSGRSKRSQTRIAPGVRIWQAGVAAGARGQGSCELSQSSWATLASPSSWPGGGGTANSGSGQRGGWLVEPERAFVRRRSSVLIVGDRRSRRGRSGRR